jgi:type VI secretion system protein ImpC
MSSSEQAASGAPATTTTTQDNASLLSSMLESMPQTEPDRGKQLIKALIDEVMGNTITWDRNVTKSIEAGMKAIDEAMSRQLAAILHHPDFQKLEGTWRGLNYLVKKSETSTMLKIKVLNVSKKELFRDLDRATEFDQSQIYKKIYENEYGMPGGEPYGALIGDYEFKNHTEDIGLLSKMSNVAAAAFCPFISAAGPEMFGFKSWTDLSRPRDLEKIFDSVEYTQWRSFRESEDSRFVTLVMPRVLARLPYGKGTVPVDEFGFEEIELDAQGRAKPVPHSDYTWMNAAYVMGTRLTNAFAKFRWCTAIRGFENGGMVEDLPAHIFISDDGDPDLKCPTEIGITDRREAELSKVGFLPLCHYKNKDYAVFFGAQTTQKPKLYDRPEATANAAISARLPYIMATSRIAHYLKCMARDWIGSFMDASDCEARLNRWINNYVNTAPTPTAEMKAKWPLREAKIKVSEIPGKPGSYSAEAWLRPWLQLEELTTALMMVAKLPARASK